MKIDNPKRLVIAVLLVFGAGALGSIATAPSIPTWYASLNKPWFNPPNWLFGPAWSTLYILIGVSFYLVWKQGINEKTKIPIALFGIQLALNSLWSVIFFGLQAIFYAFAEIVVLWFFILATMITFYRISKRAGYLFVPYIVWVTFASMLNLFVWLLNP